MTKKEVKQVVNVEKNFTDWVIERSKMKNKFFIYWESQRKKNPEDFPATLTLAEWDEQFKMWEMFLEEGT